MAVLNLSDMCLNTFLWSQIVDNSDSDSLAEQQTLIHHNSELRSRLSKLFSKYQLLRYFVEDNDLGGADKKSPVVQHEDDIVEEAIEDFLKSQECEESRIISKSRTTQKPGISCIIQTPPDKLPALCKNAMAFENERLRCELDELRMKYSQTPLNKLRSELAEAKASVSICIYKQRSPHHYDELRILMYLQLEALEEGDKSHARMCYEVRRLKDENSKLQAGIAFPNVKRQLQLFTVNTQLQLEKSALEAKCRATMAEEQLKSLQKYMTNVTFGYQKEIMRMRGLNQQRN